MLLKTNEKVFKYIYYSQKPARVYVLNNYVVLTTKKIIIKFNLIKQKPTRVNVPNNYVVPTNNKILNFKPNLNLNEFVF